MIPDDNVSVLGQSLPLPLAGQCAALGTVLASLFACAAAWAALQRQVCKIMGLMSGVQMTLRLCFLAT